MPVAESLQMINSQIFESKDPQNSKGNTASVTVSAILELICVQKFSIFDVIFPKVLVISCFMGNSVVLE